MERVWRMGNPPPRTVAIVRALRGLGDMLCAVPAFRALRAALPETVITLVTLPENRPFVSRFRHYLDDYVEFPGFPGIPERALDVRALPRWLEAAQKKSFDLAIQMHGNGMISNQFTYLLGAKITAGCHIPAQDHTDGEHFLEYRCDQPEVTRYLRLAEFLGAPSRGEQLEFPLTAADYKGAYAIPEVGRLEPQGYVCVHPGANTHSRRWPAERFASVADRLAREGYSVVLTGLADEADVTATVLESMTMPALDLAGRTGMGELGVLLSHARLVVSNDTGVSHVADALRVPSVIVFMNSEPKRWAPLDTERHRAVYDPKRFAAADIPIERVLTEVEFLLNKEHTYVA